MPQFSTIKQTNNTSIRLYLLGMFRLERDTRPIHLPTRKIESLLAFLVLHPEPHPREKLAALLWGDTTDELARRSLRTALSTLRKELGEEILIADRETVQLNPEFPLWMDAREFENTLELYQGDLLADFYDDWILPEREQLRTIYIDALLQLTQHHRAKSEYAQAMVFAQKILATDLANEKAYQHLIFCSAALGDRIGALKQFDECAKKLRDELGVEPSHETIALRDKIEGELTGAKSREALLTNLPHPLTSFIGREKEIAEVKHLLAQNRLVTLTGSGGCGKTRLTIEVASQVVESFQNGVWWVDLAPLSDASLVLQTAAQSLGLRETSHQSLDETLITFLRNKHLLLILDNCEHLITACTQLAEKLLSACAELKILATSRESLGIAGEVAWRVPSFALPDVEHLPPLERLMQYDAIQLFVQRAQASAPNWRLNGNAPSVARVCVRLDGIPLAIELAAARVKVLSVEQIAMRLNDRFHLLAGGNRTSLPRQQTLRATLDWSYDLLLEKERTLLQRLSVFAGGWTIEAAEYVCVGDGLDAIEILDLLGRLVDKSLVIADEHMSETRYRMLETVREYARENLTESNDLQNRHLAYFLKLAEEAETKLAGAEHQVWFARLETEYNSLRAAWEWAIEHDVEMAFRLAWALREFWQGGWHVSEARAWLATLLRYIEGWGISAKRARVLSLAAEVACFHRDYVSASKLAEEGLTIARKTESKFEIAFGLSRMATSSFFRGNFQTARDLFEASLTLWREFGDDRNIARQLFGLAMVARDQRDFELAQQLFADSEAKFRALGDILDLRQYLIARGELARLQGDYRRAAKFYEECIELNREYGNNYTITLANGNLGFALLREGNFQKARMLFEESLGLARQFGKGDVTYLGLVGLAGVIGATGKPELAAQLLGAVESGIKTYDIILQPSDRADYDYIWANISAQLDEATFERARTEGRAFTLEQAMEYALEHVK